MDLGLKDKVAVITGGSRGIGKACAKELLAEGAIAVLVSKSPDSNAAAVREFEKIYPGRVIGIPTDVNDDAAIGAMTEQVIAKFGRIDILINAAATVIPQDFFKMDDAHLTGEYFKMMTGIDMVPVHYRGAAQAIPDLMAGRVQVMFDIVVSSLSYINAGQLRAIAVATPTPHELLPGIPTIGESVPGFEAGGWQGACAPSKTPADIVDKLNREINTMLADAKLKARLVELGGLPSPGTPAEFGKFIASETDKWGKVVRQAGLKID